MALSSSGPSCSPRVRRDLPAVRDLLGRYLLAAKRQDEVIGRRDVAEQPRLPPAGAGPATVVYQLPEPHRALAELLAMPAAGTAVHPYLTAEGRYPLVV